MKIIIYHMYNEEDVGLNYIGHTVTSIQERFKKHFHGIQNTTIRHPKNILYQTLASTDKANWKIEALEVADYEVQLPLTVDVVRKKRLYFPTALALEQKWINRLKPSLNVHNARDPSSIRREASKRNREQKDKRRQRDQQKRAAKKQKLSPPLQPPLKVVKPIPLRINTAELYKVLMALYCLSKVANCVHSLFEI